jgi:hypothetical protein
MAASGPRSRVGVALDLPSLDVAHLRQRFFNPDDHIPPPPLADTDAEAAAATSLEELRMQGGPNLGAFRELIATVLHGQDAVSAGELFAVAGGDLRRPVEVFGLLHIAAASGAPELGHSGETDLFEAIRPDGSRRSFTATRTVFTREQLAALEAEDLDGTS